MKQNRLIQVFEYDKLMVGNSKDELTTTEFNTLEKHFGSKGVPYYTLIYNGIKFNNYVGVLQIDNLTIEVLPKIDRIENDSNGWKKILTQLLHYTGEIEVDTSEFSNLNINKISLLELYFSLFIKECDYLLHRGLIKKYRKEEGNLFALKGALQFNKNINNNLTHSERFYTTHTVYNHQHLLHQILVEAMNVVKKVSTSSNIISTTSKLLLNYPLQNKLKVTDATFGKITFNRKTEPYKKAINIAKMILLNYYPEFTKNSNSVLALFFDMNLLWEKYVAKVLKNNLASSYEIVTQNKELFWESSVVPNANIKPDILILKDNSPYCIIDTKWKLPYDDRPSDADLKQMFVYNKKYNCNSSWLLYPHIIDIKKDGNFFDEHGSCGMLLTTILEDSKLKHLEYYNKISSLLCL